MAFKITLTHDSNIICGEVLSNYTSSSIPTYPFSLNSYHNLTCVELYEKYNTTGIVYKPSSGSLTVGGEVYEDGCAYIYGPSFTASANKCYVTNINSFDVTLYYNLSTDIYPDATAVTVSALSSMPVFTYSEDTYIRGYFWGTTSDGNSGISVTASATLTYSGSST